jgi:hypothetical protein
MKYLVLLSVCFLFLAGCFDRLDYDIEEVAPAEFLSTEDEHDHETCTIDEHDHDHQEAGQAAPLDSTTLTETHDMGVHLHDAGVRNHGTQWFFNQPWAASFVWDKMLRDSIILLVLAVSVFFIPRLWKKRK